MRDGQRERVGWERERERVGEGAERQTDGQTGRQTDRQRWRLRQTNRLRQTRKEKEAVIIGQRHRDDQQTDSK